MHPIHSSRDEFGHVPHTQYDGAAENLFDEKDGANAFALSLFSSSFHLTVRLWLSSVYRIMDGQYLSWSSQCFFVCGKAVTTNPLFLYLRLHRDSLLFSECGFANPLA